MTRRAVTFGALILASLPLGATTLDDLQSQVDAGRYAAAAADAKAYLALHPGHRDARFLRARALAGQGDTDKAIAALESLAHDYPLRPEPANNLAVLYAKQGDYDKARQWLEKAMATQPAYATAHRNLGDVYTALADLAYRKALGSDDVAAKTPLTMLDRFYYAQESVAAGDACVPLPRRAPVTPPQPETQPEPPQQAAAPSPQPAAEPAPEPEPEPLPEADDSRSIVQTVRAWALAWSDQDYDAYVDFYADDFDPGDDMTLAAWKDLRKSRLSRPDKIHIKIESPTVERLGADRARVEFVQKYDSPRYSDVVTKELWLERTGAGWRIVREASTSS